jgi:peptide/nickel transport system substrate-binding protein
MARLIDMRALIIVAILAATLGTIACGGAEQAPVAAPTIDTGAIQDAVKEAVAASVPEATSAEDIQRMVEAAVAASVTPGVSSDEIKRLVTDAVQASAAKQLTAAEIQKIVGASVQALPAPELDTNALRTLVRESVAASVPEGTSQIELAKMVEAAVVAAQKEAVTRGDMEAMVAKAVSQAAADQMSPAEVEKIVSAAVGAAVQAPSARISQIPLDREQILRFPRAKPGAGLAPWRNAGANNRYFNSVIFQPLFRLNSQHDIIPGVATRYEESSDGLTYTVHLDPNAIFTDGTPITAADVKAAWEFGASPDEQGRGAQLTHLRLIEGFDAVIEGTATEAAGVVVVDEQTLAIKLAAPYPLFPFSLANSTTGLGKWHVQAKEDPEWERAPIGVGAFTALWDPDKKYLELHATDNWWKDKPTIQKVEMIGLRDRTIHHIMFENNEVDIIHPVGASPAFRIGHPFNKLLSPIPVPGINYFAFRVDIPPFDDIKVRMAFAHAVDMEAVNTAQFGPGVNDVPAGLLPPGFKCADPSRTGLEYNPTLAKQYLAESKYGSELANFPPVIIPQWSDVRILRTEIVQQMLKDNLGIDITIARKERTAENHPDSNFIQSVTVPAVPDPVPVMEVFVSSENLQAIHSTGIKDANLDAMFKKLASTSLDDPDRCKAVREIENAFLEGYYIVPGYNTLPFFLVQPWVEGFSSSMNYDIESLLYMKLHKKDRDLYD